MVLRNEEDLVKAHHDPKAYYADYIAPYKGQLEVWYAGKRGFSLYLKVIILTILVVFLPSMKLLWKVLPDLPMADEPLRTDLKMEQILILKWLPGLHFVIAGVIKSGFVLTTLLNCLALDIY